MRRHEQREKLQRPCSDAVGSKWQETSCCPHIPKVPGAEATALRVQKGDANVTARVGKAYARNVAPNSYQYGKRLVRREGMLSCGITKVDCRNCQSDFEFSLSTSGYVTLRNSPNLSDPNKSGRCVVNRQK